MKKTTSLLTISLFLAMAIRLQAAEQDFNMLKNGDFSLIEEGSPKFWKNASGNKVEISLDQAEKPKQAKTSMKVTLKDSADGLGQILQKISIKSNTAYFLRGQIKSDKGFDAFVQIKLYKDKKEVLRIPVKVGGEQWNELKKEFDSGEADAAEVLCRFKQKADCVGKSAWFANLLFIPASERVRDEPQVKKVSAVTTYSSIGLYADVSGDVSAKTSCSAEFRKKGETEWRKALDLVWHGLSDQFRGSILNLEENTEYEVRIALDDPYLKKKEGAKGELTAKTWTSAVPVAQTITLPAGKIGEPLVIDKSGTEDGWILYTTSPDSPSIIEAGNTVENAVVIKEVSFVIIENLTIRGGTKDAVLIRDSNHVRVRRCDIANWGTKGTWDKAKNGKGPLWIDETGEVINLQGGVRVIGDNSTQITIEDNYIHNPNGHANSWQFGHPHGPTSIILHNPGGNIVIRNNDLVGNEKHRFNDTIEGAYNKYPNGGPHRDTDFDGNIMLYSNDDGVELDGGQMNVRFFNNWIESSYCGVSCAPNRLGPSYVYRNLIVLEGEERGMTNFAFKMGGDQFPEPGVSFLFHNTVYSHNAGLKGGNFGKGPAPIVTRNNLFTLGELIYKPVKLGDFDYDMLRPGSILLGNPEWEKHGVTATADLLDRDKDDYRLPENSPAIDKGLILPTVNENYVGAAPDLGAFEQGAAPAFPVRGNRMTILPLRSMIKILSRDSETQTAKVKVTVPAALGKTWKATTDCPWIKCSPESGVCDGKEQELTLSFNGLEWDTRLYRGAFTIRTDLGYNRTAVVHGESRLKDPQRFIFEAENLECKGFELKDDAEASGGKCLQAVEDYKETQLLSAAFNVNIQTPGTYYIMARTMSPGPNASSHDSLFVQVDENEKIIWDFPISAPSNWAWNIGTMRKDAYPLKIELQPGEHKITIWGREPLVKIDQVTLSLEPLPPLE
ncbi:MAG: right-handed parallel beta-helix repeat-containing protein [Planctomycetes bacterium]|nr:right-handed parallel beta-helix repeat-containing protein [Planctomycetota bacterium]